jgi:RNA polymerase sigma factor (sigma-70 family)
MDPKELLTRARTGDAQAWNDLLLWSRPFVRALLRRRLMGCVEDASDLTNDVQMRMHQGFPGFRGVSVGQFVAWTKVVARNVLVDHFDEGKLPVVPLPPVDPPSPQTDISAPLIRAEDLVRLAAALERLPAPYRRVIEARLFEGLAPSVIAERLGWPPVRVRVYSKRAIEILSAQLRGEP